MTQLKLALQTQRLFLDFEGRRRYFRFIASKLHQSW
jgi:hypothetical protein